MSNYNSLKTTIDANIKQNGNQEITGQILNSVLNQMVTTLGTGYQFAGVATIDTNPGTPDAKVFYIANGKGTYTNFGGINVTEDEVVVLYWDTAWHKEATGIASQEKLTELESEVAQGLYTFSAKTPLATGVGFINELGNIEANALYEYKVFAITANEPVKIVGGYNNAPIVRIWAFYSSETPSSNTLVELGEPTPNKLVERYIYAPDGATHIVISYSKSYSSHTSVYGKTGIISTELNNKVKDNSTKISSLESVEKELVGYSAQESTPLATGVGFINELGNIEANALYEYKVFELDFGKVKAVLGGVDAPIVKTYAFYNSVNIGSSSLIEIGQSSTTAFKTYELAPPNEATHIAISYLKSTAARNKVYMTELNVVRKDDMKDFGDVKYFSQLVPIYIDYYSAETESSQDGFIVSDGSLDSNVLYVTEKIKVTQGDRVRIVGGGVDAPSVILYAFYSSSNIGASTCVKVGASTTIEKKTYDEVVPDGATYLCISYNKTYSTGTAAYIGEFQAKGSVRYYAAVSDTSISVNSKYSSGEDMCLTFRRCSVNNTFQLYAFGKISNVNTLPSTSTSTDKKETSIPQTDFLSPFKMRADNNPTYVENNIFTGGWHTTNGGKATAKFVSVDIFVDGKKVDGKYMGYANEIEIIAKSEVCGYNTLTDGASIQERYILEETDTYFIRDGKIDVCVNFKAKEPLKIATYYGLQTTGYSTNVRVYCDNIVNRTFADGDYTITSPTTAICVGNNDGDYLISHIEFVGLGNGNHKVGGYALIQSYGKTYYCLVGPNGELAMNEGDEYYVVGSYKFSSNNDIF